MHTITPEPLRPADTAAAATLLSQAFLTQPNNIAIRRAQDERVRRKIETFFRIAKLERPFATLWVAQSGDRMAGVLNMVEWPRCRASPPVGFTIAATEDMPGVPNRFMWRGPQSA